MSLFKTKRFDFFEMLSLQATKSSDAIKALNEFIRDPKKEKGEEVEKIEAEADEIRKMLIEELNIAFVTPIDREDIFSLSRAIDDCADYAKSTVEEMLLFEVKTNSYFINICEVLYDASIEISFAIKNLKKQPRISAEHIIKAKKAENIVEHRYREGLVELFKTNDAILIIKTREIYRHLSNAADRIDEAANIIGDIVVKTT